MGKSFNRSDDESFKTIHRPRSRKVRDEFFLVDSDSVLIDDIPDLEMRDRDFHKTRKDKR